MVNKFKEDHLEPRLRDLSVTDEEIGIHYRENREKYTLPDKVRIAVIFVGVSPRASAERMELSRKRIESALEEARRLEPGTSSFGPVAVRYSEDQATRYRGGDAGWLERGNDGYRWPGKLVEAAFTLEEPGALSPVITADEGFYLVKLMERISGSVQPLEDVKGHIRYRLLALKKEAVLEEFFREMEERVKVEVNRDLLGAMELPADGSGGQGPPPLPR
jgi:parvulin-like peptidyl-prolyl isomerase